MLLLYLAFKVQPGDINVACIHKAQQNEKWHKANELNHKRSPGHREGRAANVGVSNFTGPHPSPTCSMHLPPVPWACQVGKQAAKHIASHDTKGYKGLRTQRNDGGCRVSPDSVQRQHHEKHSRTCSNDIHFV